MPEIPMYAQILIGIYLLLGFIYAIWKSVNKSGGIFSIPVNMVLGPILVPILFIILMKRESYRRYTKADIPHFQELYDAENK